MLNAEDKNLIIKMMEKICADCKSEDDGHIWDYCGQCKMYEVTEAIRNMDNQLKGHGGENVYL